MLDINGNPVNTKDLAGDTFLTLINIIGDETMDVHNMQVQVDQTEYWDENILDFKTAFLVMRLTCIYIKIMKNVGKYVS